MSKFATTGHSVEEKEFVSKYMEPGVHIAKISKVEHVVSQGGTQGMKITHETKPLEGQQYGQTAETTWWLSEASWTFTKDRLVIMADKLGVREAFDAATGSATSEQDLVLKLSKVFTGKAARWKFSGIEVQGKEGKKNWFKAELSAYGFVESLTVPASESKLKFDPNNKYDMKHLPKADAVTTATSTTDEVSW